MTSTKFGANALRLSVSLALAAGLTTGAGNAYAQDQAATTTEGRVEVTGTRIRQIDLETAQPVHTISRADIDQQGFTSVGEILQNITSTAGVGFISRAAPLSSGENAGGTHISMRNLGASRTLVLVNGMRLGISTAGLADVSIIPVAAIERIEVLKDGASSIYGSDAIGGVINIITRSGFDGVRGSFMYGEQSEGDQETERADFVMGFTGARGSLTTTFETFSEGIVMFRDRPFSAHSFGPDRPNRGWTVVGEFGGFSDPIPGLGGRRVLADGGDWRNVNDWIPQDLNTVDSTLHKSNPNEQMSLRSARESRAIYVDGQYDLTDAVRFSTGMLYSHREDHRIIAGYPYQAAAFGTSMSEDSYFNPFGTHHGYAGEPQELHGWWRRGWEVPRTTDADLTTFRISSGLDGSFEALGRFFEWDFNHLYSTNTSVQRGFGDFNIANVAAAVGPSFLDPITGRVTCGTPDNPIPLSPAPDNCVPWNPFLDTTMLEDGAITNNPGLRDFLFQTVHNSGETSTQVFNFNLTGPLVAMPAGDLHFAAGVEHRKEQGRFTPDAMAVTGNSSTLAAGETMGGYSVAEVYGELLIPLLSAMPMAEELSLSLATRYSDYDTFGDTTNSKVGITWQPFNELMIRGTWSEGFRAPTISNLYSGGSQTFAFYTDPCDTLNGAAANDDAVLARCNEGPTGIEGTPADFRQLAQGMTPCTATNCQTPLAFVSGANPLLQPEESEGFTLGVVWSPETMVPGLTLLADYWRVKVTNTIVGDAPTSILNDCYIEGIDARCVGFSRDPVTGIVNQMAFGSRNAGFIDVRGIDFDATYRFTTDGLGAFSVNWNNTYTLGDRFRSTDDPDVHPSHAVGHGGTFRYRSNLNLGWSMGDFSANWIARYYSSMREACVLAAGEPAFPDECSHPEFQREWLNQGNVRPTNKVGSNTFHDVQVRWTAPWNGMVSVGANNVFDRHGPMMYSQPNSNIAYYGGFDIGRFWYVRYQQDF